VERNNWAVGTEAKLKKCGIMESAIVAEQKRLDWSGTAIETWLR
jgi:hypothetical protein